MLPGHLYPVSAGIQNIDIVPVFSCFLFKIAFFISNSWARRYPPVRCLLGCSGPVYTAQLLGRGTGDCSYYGKGFCASNSEPTTHKESEQ